MSHLISTIKNNKRLVRFFSRLKVRFSGNHHIQLLQHGIAIIRKCSCQSKGHNNQVIVGDFSVLERVNFQFIGDNNRIVIGQHCRLQDASIVLEDGNCFLSIGENCSFGPNLEIGMAEGTQIKIGNDCLFSSHILMMTTDSHAIGNQGGARINPSKNIELKSHVWVGTRAMILKGVTIGQGSLVGAGSLLTAKTFDANCVIAGCPAKAIKTDVHWSHGRDKPDSSEF